MLIEPSNKYSLDRPATYQINVPGVISHQWANMIGEISIMAGNDADGLPISTLTVTVDQAGLHGLLRRLYSLGLPLISVIYVEIP